MTKLLLAIAVFSALLACSKGALEPSNDEELVQQSDASPPMIMPSSPPSSPASTPSLSIEAGVDAAVVDAEVPSLVCVSGRAEIEPNDTTASASPLTIGKTCGAVAAGDVDFFVLALDGSGTVRFDATSEDVRFFFGDIELFAGDSINVDGAGSRAFIRVESTSKQGYTITRH